jgi:predicted transcriptional regulator
LGFAEVYDYVVGKVDWLAHSLPVERDAPAPPTAADFMRDDVVRCGLDDRVGEVRERIAPSPYGFAVATTSDGVVLGRVRGSVLDCDPILRVEEVMEPGPSTTRPDRPVDSLIARLDKQDLRFAIVTTPEGRLLGVVRRSDLEPG